jgi:tRNA-Thr(GGU) m(6)t(6)A37 methyltransferase TsaA
MELIAIGIISTPYDRLSDCPRNIGQENVECIIHIFEPYRLGLSGLVTGQNIEILYWLDLAKFDSLIQTSRKTKEPKGIFALRTPKRPNPIGTAVVAIDTISEATIIVRGLDCLNGTTLLDIKPAFNR